MIGYLIIVRVFSETFSGVDYLNKHPLLFCALKHTAYDICSSAQSFAVSATGRPDLALVISNRAVVCRVSIPI